MSSHTPTPASGGTGRTYGTSNFPIVVMILLGVLLVAVLWRVKYTKAEQQMHLDKYPKEQAEYKRKEQMKISPPTPKEPIEIGKIYIKPVFVGVWSEIPTPSRTDLVVQTSGKNYLYKNSCGVDSIFIDGVTQHEFNPCAHVWISAYGEDKIIEYRYIQR